MRHKFRIFDKRDNILTDDFGHFYISADGRIYDVNSELDITDSVVLMKNVGLFDDSGNSIFEGDIVEVIDSNETKTSHTSEVIFTYDGALIKSHQTHVSLGISEWRTLSHYCDYGVGDGRSCKCFIIGNIYEDKEE